MTESVDNSELEMWRDNEISQYVIKEINKKIMECKMQLTDGTLMVSPVLDREYCSVVGELRGYKYFLEIVGTGDKSE